ncbi:hypothetical protein QZH41_008869, partial [Actinostola sp. cb2023]
MAVIRPDIQKMKLVNIMLALTVAMTITDQAKTLQQERVLNILVFTNRKDQSMNSSILQEARRLISRNHTNYNVENWNVKFIEHHFMSSRPQTTLSFLCNLTNNNNNITVDGAIFLEITRSTALLSQSLRNVNIPTIGLHDSGHVKEPVSSEALMYFSRVPTLPLQKFAFIIKDFINKMGWRKVCIIESADMEGLQFAQSMLHFAEQEQWRNFTATLLESQLNKASLNEVYDKISRNEPDVIIVNNLGKHLNNVLGAANTTSSVWLLTDNSLVSMDQLPAGVLRVSQRKAVPDYHHFVEIQLLSDAMRFFESAVSDTVTKLCRNSDDVALCQNQLDRLEVREHVTSFISNKPATSSNSVFAIPGPYDPPKQSYDLFNLRVDLQGHNHWYSIGMWTSAGIAIDSFINQHGQRIVPPVLTPRPVLRVPVVRVPSWMEVGKPYHLAKENICLSGSPCYVLDPSGLPATKHCCVGAQIDLINLLENDLKFKAFIYFALDGKWGGFDSLTGRWTGLMGELTSLKADVTSLLGISKARNEAVGFTQPYMELGMNILVRKTDKSSKYAAINWKFLFPFDYDLWLMITGVSNVFLLVIWGLDRISRMVIEDELHCWKKIILRKMTASLYLGLSLLSDSMSYVWGVAFSKDIGAENTPKSPSARVVSIFFAFMALILVNTYCAKLTAVLMRESFAPPIQGIRDQKLINPSLYPPNGFQLGVVGGSIEEWYFRNHSDSHIQLLYNINIKINLVNSYEDGFKQLQN